MLISYRHQSESRTDIVGIRTLPSFGLDDIDVMLKKGNVAAAAKALHLLPYMEIDGREQFLVYEKKIISITGVWDLPLLGSEELDVEHRYQFLTGGPPVELVGLDGLFVGALYFYQVGEYTTSLSLDPKLRDELAERRFKLLICRALVVMTPYPAVFFSIRLSMAECSSYAF